MSACLSANLLLYGFCEPVEDLHEGAGACGRSPPTRIKCVRECARFDSSMCEIIDVVNETIDEIIDDVNDDKSRIRH